MPNLVNQSMVNGVTPVYLAVQENSFTITKYLAYHGANLSARSLDGMNILHLACQNGNLEMVEFLVL